MDDLISRQAAIDVVAEFLYYTSNFDGMRQGFDLSDWKWKMEGVLSDLPSAQPEIIRCRNCKFASGDSRICMKFGHSPIGELDFCAWAERRTDE